MTECTESRERMAMIFEQLPNTLYLEGIYDAVRNINPDTKQLNTNLITSFLRVSKMFLSMIPYSTDGLIKIFERIELQFSKTATDTPEFNDAQEILHQVLERVKSIQELYPTKSMLNAENLVVSQPPNDYHRLPIIPNLVELLAENKPYLRKNIVDGIYEDAHQYIDIHFRLLREDFVGPLRDGIQHFLCKRKDKNFNVRIYENVHTVGSRLTRYNGLVYDLHLDEKVASRIFWANSRRLIYGNLLLLSFDNFQSYLFATVEDRSNIAQRFIVSVKLLETFDDVGENRMSLDQIDPFSALTMLETMTYFEAYRPILKALQTIRLDRFLLAPLLLKLSNVETPPDYITSATTYDFTPLLNHRFSSTESKSVSVLEKETWPTNEQLMLNPKQYEALRLALTHKVALIQGPPGTGKTYLGARITEMLLHNRTVWCRPDEQSTPILMICHTNHALDQFLELIVKRLDISRRIIRVGSRCQNPTIQKFSLKNVREQSRYNRSRVNQVGRQKYAAIAEKTQIEEALKLKRKELEKFESSNFIYLSTFEKHAILDERHHLSLIGSCYDADTKEQTLLVWLGFYTAFEFKPMAPIAPEHVQIEENEGKAIDHTTEEDEEENRRRDDDSELEEKPREWDSNRQFNRSTIASTTILTDQAVQQMNDNVWALNLNERIDLYRYWLSKYRRILQNSLDDLNQEYNRTIASLNDYRQEEDYYLLRDSSIVAMTTTCAAKYHRVLQKLQSKIVIVEESAAIFEAHIITALNAKCQHLILIGDHIQLKPNPSVYRLAAKYQIDVSLFERLINNKFPNVRLNIQHRMRPEIADLMKHFYEDLENHISVDKIRAPIRGIESSLFFVNHDHPETNINDGSSKKNEFEAKYLIALAQYLIKQGYQPQQITLLVMYLGQRQFIAKQVKNEPRLAGMQITVTDNYQGEENDIILLSLVRSNKEKSIGFLTLSNRICVALSRARCGFYVIGNISLLAEVDDMWKKIFESLVTTNHIGKGLYLSCRQHVKDKFLADKPESFAQRPEGGCRKICDARLKCGHSCELMCHNYDFEHENIKCYKRCDEQLSCGHMCKKNCHFETPDRHEQCRRIVKKTIQKCGHEVGVECYRTPDMIDCKQSLSERLACGHFVDVPCRIIASAIEFKRFICPKPCGAMLSCEHKCIGKCGDCCAGKVHVPCGHKCQRELICSHICKAPCASNCPPCLEDCQTRCAHSRCRRKCGDICTPCKEPCLYRCRHLQCNRLCSEQCDRPPCNEPCRRKLECGHSCIGLCGEQCPPQCRKCHQHEVQEIFFGNEDEPDARFVYLPDCRHIIEVNALDQYMNGFLNDSNAKIAIRFPECPRCRQKMYRCVRYTGILNQIYEYVSKVKRKILGGKSKSEMDERRVELFNKYSRFTRDVRKVSLIPSIESYFSRLHNETALFSEDMISFMSNMLGFLWSISKILVKGYENLSRDRFVDLVNCPLQYIINYMFEQRHDRNFADQQLTDIRAELERIRRVIYIESFTCSIKQTLNDIEHTEITSMQQLTRKSGPFTVQDRENFDALMKKYEYLRNIPGLAITEDERVAIVSALNMKKGHWYVCPNGHPYVITECGGANQESQCPDCGEQIGGQNHRLVSTNRHFGLIDHSQHAAWSNEANLHR